MDTGRSGQSRNLGIIPEEDNTVNNLIKGLRRGAMDSLAGTRNSHGSNLISGIGHSSNAGSKDPVNLNDSRGADRESQRENNDTYLNVGRSRRTAGADSGAESNIDISDLIRFG